MNSAPFPLRRPAVARPTVPRLAGLSGSLAVHAALFAVMAALAVGPGRVEVEAPCTPLAATFTQRAPGGEEVVATTPTAAGFVPRPELLEMATLPDETVVPAPVPEPIREAAAWTETATARPSPTLDAFRHGRVSPRPGRGGGADAPVAGGGTGASAGAGSGGGSLGVGTGGRGSGSGSCCGGDGGSTRGVGVGEGDEGPGSGVADGGATHGPAYLGALAPPVYPQRARAKGLEGRVVLRLAIDVDGGVVGAGVAESSGSAELDDAACEAAFRWTFAPALQNGKPVAGTLRVPVRFELTD